MVSQAKSISGGTSHRDTSSGWFSAALRGASSPNTTWPYVTTASAQAVPRPAVPMRAGSGSVAECSGERVRERLFGQRADADAGQGDAELARGEQTRHARGRAKDDAGLGVAGTRHRLEARAAGADDGELRRHEEAIQGKEPEDGENASEHQRNVTSAVVTTPLPSPSLTWTRPTYRHSLP